MIGKLLLRELRAFSRLTDATTDLLRDGLFGHVAKWSLTDYR
jgi:hypothetical protein